METTTPTATNDQEIRNTDMDDDVALNMKSGVGASAVLFVELLLVGATTGTDGTVGARIGAGDVLFTVGTLTGVEFPLSTGAAVGLKVGVTPTGGTVDGAGVATGGVVLKVPVLALHCGESVPVHTGVKATYEEAVNSAVN